MAQEINLGKELLRICPTDNNKIEYSTTDGKTWYSRYIGSSYGDFETIQVNGTELVAYTSKGTYISKTKGQTWIKRN